METAKAGKIAVGCLTIAIGWALKIGMLDWAPWGVGAFWYATVLFGTLWLCGKHREWRPALILDHPVLTLLLFVGIGIAVGAVGGGIAWKSAHSKAQGDVQVVTTTATVQSSPLFQGPPEGAPRIEWDRATQSDLREQLRERLYGKGHRARVIYSSIRQEELADSLVALFRLAGWRVAPLVVPPDAPSWRMRRGIEVTGEDEAAIKKVANALSDMGYPQVSYVQELEAPKNSLRVYIAIRQPSQPSTP